jgi:uncharacterized secreted protein with C-terminal beta-propeller domain
MALVSYSTCDSMLAALRAHTAAHVTAYGLPDSGTDQRNLPVAVSAVAGAAAGAKKSVPDHSSTNDQVAGVDEPDIVENDGRRIVSVTGSVLRVVDVASHKLTGTLDLGMYAGADSAQLLMAGDRVLVLLGTAEGEYLGGPPIGRGYPSASGGSTALLVDVATTPRIVGTLHAPGGYVDARLVDATVRLVVGSAPKLTLPVLAGRHTNKQRVAANRAAVERAPLSAWLPTYDITTGGTTTTHTVPCTQVSHPATYTGESMLTVYTIGLAASLGDPEPIGLAADGTTVYSTGSSLYVAGAGVRTTQLHRFDISGPGRPSYLGSGTVPGVVLDSDALSEFDGSLRVVTTSGASADPSSALYVLDADSLRITGSLGGLGRDQQVHAVRFLGPMAYVVTFRSIDPLYVLDLHDPAKPVMAGSLETTGYSDYLHPTVEGRLLGVGEDVNVNGIVSGLQVSLFDVSTPAHPKRLARVSRNNTPSETPIDPHAFLYWPATGTAVVPIDSWNAGQSGAALVLQVGPDELRTVGLIHNPGSSSIDGADGGIERTLVIGGDIWTLSAAGLQASDLHTLARQAWIAFG